MTDPAPETLVAEPVPVDVTDPVAVMTALGHPPGTAAALVITPAGVLAISASYPPTDGDPAPVPTDPEEI